MTGAITYPRFNVDTQKYWAACREEKLLYQRCGECGEVVFHPRAACPYCLSPRLDWEESAGAGEIYSFTIQHLPVDRAHPGKLPLGLGIIQMDEGFHMFAEIEQASLDILKVGAKVIVWFDHVAPDLTLPKFRVIEGERA